MARRGSPAGGTSGNGKLWSAAVAILAVAVVVSCGRDAHEPAIQESVRASESATPSGLPPTPVAPSAGELVRVSSVVDGDTLHVLVDGSEARVRVIGIDAPEQDECWGAEATDAASSLLAGSSVQLIADPSQDDRDRYGRLLRYVVLPDGTDLGHALVEDGHVFEYTYNSPYRNQQTYRSAEGTAAANRTGLWSQATCDGRTQPAAEPAQPGALGPSSAPGSSSVAAPASSQAAPPPATDVEPGDCRIKGNVSDNGRIYHVPGSRDYDKTKIDPARGERWFCSTAEAEAAGWRAPRG